MRHLAFIILAISLAFTACDKDEIIDADLYHDGPNNTAPFFDPGIYEAAARFTSNEMSQFSGKQLEVFEFFILNLPTACEIRVYGEGTNNEPGPLLTSADVTNVINSNSWNNLTLSTPVPLDGSEIWLAVRLTHGQRTNSIGCDSGPADSDGDWTFSDDDNEWKSYRERTSQQVNINWNIRGQVSN